MPCKPRSHRKPAGQPPLTPARSFRDDTVLTPASASIVTFVSHSLRGKRHALCVPRLHLSREREYQCLSFHGTVRAARVPGSGSPGRCRACMSCMSAVRRSTLAGTRSRSRCGCRVRGQMAGHRQAGVQGVLRGDGRGRPVAGLTRGHARGDGGGRDLRHAERETGRLIARLQALGHTVTINPAA